MTSETRNQAHRQDSEYRAGGTDITERRRSGVSRGSVVDLVASPEMSGTAWDATGGVRIGASVTIAALAADARIAVAYPGFSAAAAGLATPQVRHIATLGGNLAQKSRCWYFRNPHIACLKKGGANCPSRDGNHLYGVAFDLGPCVAPHASTMAAALMAYDGMVTTSHRSMISVKALLGDGSDGTADNTLASDEVIVAIHLPAAVATERGYYKRAIGRVHAEWPLVELVSRLLVVDNKIQHAFFCAGGIAPVPLRLTGLEAGIVGAELNASTIAQASRLANEGARPLPMTRYKLQLLSGLVEDFLAAAAN